MEEKAEKLIHDSYRISREIEQFKKGRDPKQLNRVFETISGELQKGTGMLMAASPIGNTEGAFRISMNLLNTQDGKSYAVAFTSEKEQAKGRERGQLTTAIVLPIRNILETVMQNEKVAGLAIDPWGENFILVREAMQVLLNQDRQNHLEEKMKENGELELAISRYYEEIERGKAGNLSDEEKEPGLRRELQAVLASILNGMSRQAQVLVAVSRAEGEAKQTEQLTSESRLFLNRLKTSDGKTVLAVFTRGEEIRKGKNETGVIAMPLRDILHSGQQLGTDAGLDGVLINPWGQRFLLNRSLLDWILKAEDMEKTAEQRRAALETREMRTMGALLGAVVGNSLEYESRKKENPCPSVEGLKMGEWEQGGALLFAELDSLNEQKKLDFEDMMDRFFRQRMHGAYSADGTAPENSGRCFESAVMKNARGVSPLLCGESGDGYQSDESLQRILPFALLLVRRGHEFGDTDRAMLHQAVQLFQNDGRVKLTAEIFALMLRNLLLERGGENLEQQLAAAVNEARLFYMQEDEEGMSEEEKEMNREALEAHRESIADYDEMTRALPELGHILDITALRELDNGALPESGDAAGTLENALWCLLNTTNYQEAVIEAFAIGGKGLALVTGAIAGAAYRYEAIPKEWSENLPKREWAESLCAGFQKAWIG